jgi:membrane-anchored glycerophosphoryl diester phosphodiesterase (GDPDase)
MQFEMNRTWSEAMALVRSNFQLLALLAGLFMLLPSLILVVTMPQLLTVGLPDAAGSNPEQAAEQMMAAAPSLFGVLLVILVISLIGYAAMVALIGRDRPTVGGAIGTAVRSLPTLIGVLLIFIVGYLVGAFVLGVVVGLLAAAIGALTGSGAAGFLMAIALLVIVGYICTRLSLILPVVVLDGVRNPFAAYGRSWRLTGPDHLRIFGFFALLFVAYCVIALLLVAVMGAMGMVAGGAGTFLFGIVSGLIGVVVSMIVTGILVSMHGQLAGISTGAVSETFE